MALKGSLALPFGLAKAKPQLTAKDLLLIDEIKQRKEWNSWEELFKQFLRESAIAIPVEFQDEIDKIAA